MEEEALKRHEQCMKLFRRYNFLCLLRVVYVLVYIYMMFYHGDQLAREMIGIALVLPAFMMPSFYYYLLGLASYIAIGVTSDQINELTK